MSCGECGNPDFAPHSSVCGLYTPDVHRVDGVTVVNLETGSWLDLREV